MTVRRTYTPIFKSETSARIALADVYRKFRAAYFDACKQFAETGHTLEPSVEHGMLSLLTQWRHDLDYATSLINAGSVYAAISAIENASNRLHEKLNSF